MDQLLCTIGYSFINKSLLQEALTHPSANQDKDIFSYERLEFLGDAVLDFLISEMLFSMFPKDTEGSLAKKKVALVCGNTLYEIAKFLCLGDFIIMSEGERRGGGASNFRNLENAMEALIAALYLDGGWAAVRNFVNKYWLERANALIDPPRDAKTTLQEWAQSKKMSVPNYVVIKESGVAHKPTFTIELQIDGYEPVQANGNTKKMAEHAAAKIMLERLNCEK